MVAIRRYAISLLAALTAMLYFGSACISAVSGETGWIFFNTGLAVFYIVFAVMNLPETTA